MFGESCGVGVLFHWEAHDIDAGAAGRRARARDLSSRGRVMSKFPSVLSPSSAWRSHSAKRSFPSTVLGYYLSAFSVCFDEHASAGHVRSAVWWVAEAPWGSRQITHRLWPSARTQSTLAEVKECSPLEGLSAPTALLAGGSSTSPCWTVWTCVPAPQIPLSASPQYQSQFR